MVDSNFILFRPFKLQINKYLDISTAFRLVLATHIRRLWTVDECARLSVFQKYFEVYFEVVLFGSFYRLDVQKHRHYNCHKLL